MCQRAITGRSSARRGGLRAGCLGFVAAGLLALAGAGTAAADQIAYVCGNDICTIDAANPATHADLTETPLYDDLHPAWSPDGTRIAFTGDYPPHDEGDIYVLSPAHPEPVTDVTDSPSDADGAAAWSADGSELAWESEPMSSADIYIDVAAADGSTAPQQIVATAEGGHVQDREPAWSPTGARLAFSRHTYVYLASPAASLVASYLAGGAGVAPAWSPDGSRIAIVGETGNTHIVHLVDADGDGGAAALPVGAEHGSSVGWSPDGTHVVYVDENDQVRVAPTDPVGPGYTITLPSGVIVPHHPSFSPDGSQIAFNAEDSNGGGYEQVYLAPAAGGEATRLTSAPETNIEPVWQPQPGVSPGGGTGGGGTGAGAGGSTPSGGGSGSGGGAPAAPPPTARVPVTVKLAIYRHPVIGPYFMGAGYVDCSLGSTNAACQVEGEAATYVAPAGLSRTLSGHPRAKRRKVVFAKGAVKVPAGKSAPLKLKITPAGRKLLRPGRSLKVTLSVTERAPGAKPTKTTRTLTLKAPKG